MRQRDLFLSALSGIAATIAAFLAWNLADAVGAPSHWTMRMACGGLVFAAAGLLLGRLSRASSPIVSGVAIAPWLLLYLVASSSVLLIINEILPMAVFFGCHFAGSRLGRRWAPSIPANLVAPLD